MWEKEKMQTSKFFLRCNNNIDVVQSLEVLQKMVGLRQNEGFQVLKLESNLRNLTINDLRNCSSAIFNPCREGNKDLLKEISEHMVTGPLIVCTREPVVNEILFRKSLNNCK